MPSHCSWKGFVKDQVGADRRNGRCRRRNQGAVCHRRELETVELEHGIEHLSIDSHKNNPRPICLAGEKLCHVPTETEVLVKEDDHADDEEPEGRNGCWRPIREQPFERNGLESPQKPDEGQEIYVAFVLMIIAPFKYHRCINIIEGVKKTDGAIYLFAKLAAA